MNGDAYLPAGKRPTRVRYGVLGFACALSMITYLDRVCLASAVTPISEALHLDNADQLDWAFAAFALAYALFEIPSGWLGDVYGPRRTLIRIVLWWSVFTALMGLTGLIGGLIVLIITNFFFGVGEAGAFPNITRALHNWFPFRERGFAQGAVWMAGRLMGGLTPLLWLLLVEGLHVTQTGSDGVEATALLFAPLLHWRAAFFTFGLLGLLWCVLFSWWFRNRPEQNPAVNEAELALIQAGRSNADASHAGVPWGRLIRNRNLWALCLMYFCAAYGWYFNITYLPHFLDQRGVDKHSVLGALYKGGPLWLGAVACLLGGFLTDWFIRRTGSRKWGRRLFGVLGHGLCAACCFLAFLYPSDPFYIFLFISLAAFWNDLTMGAAWAACQDIGLRYAAIVAGCMNFIGNLGGAVVGKVTGVILRQTAAAHAANLGVKVSQLTPEQRNTADLLGYRIDFFMFGVAYLIAVALWLYFDSTKPVVPEENQPEA